MKWQRDEISANDALGGLVASLIWRRSPLHMQCNTSKTARPHLGAVAASPLLGIRTIWQAGMHTSARHERLASPCGTVAPSKRARGLRITHTQAGRHEASSTCKADSALDTRALPSCACTCGNAARPHKSINPSSNDRPADCCPQPAGRDARVHERVPSRGRAWRGHDCGKCECWSHLRKCCWQAVNKRQRNKSNVVDTHRSCGHMGLW